MARPVRILHGGQLNPQVNTSTSSVAASVTSVQLVAEDQTRTGATFYNEDAAAVLYVKLGATASLTDYTVQVRPGCYYELPYGYAGRVDGIWDVASGNARITELTNVVGE